MSELLTEDELQTMRHYDEHAAGLSGYYDWAERDFFAGPHIDWWRSEAERFAGYLPPNPTILSLGAGTAFDTKFFAEAGGSYTGADISHGALEVAATRSPQPRLARMNIRELGFADNSFDGVWTWDALNHLPKDGLIDVLRETRRVLRPGGFLYMGVLVDNEVNRHSAAIEEYGLNLSFWTPDEMFGAYEAAGLWGVDIRQQEDTVHLIAKAKD